MSTAAALKARGGEPPLVVHLVHRFDTGGLENGVVNLINRMPASAYRHAVVALTEVVPNFARRIGRNDVVFHSLHKPPGQGFKVFPSLYRLLRALRPAIVHSRNLGALECQAAAWAARVPVRLHGEHGRDVADPDGSNLRHRWMRRAYGSFVQQWVALSADLAGYLEHAVGVAPRRVVQIYNGVDTARFLPAAGMRPPIPGCPFGAETFIVGSVGRMQAIKDPLTLVRAFVAALRGRPGLRDRLRLVMVGGGPLLEECRAFVAQAGVSPLAWLPGERADVPDVMRGLDAFVLPSLAEGISNTILEAMACGLPVLATRVGGNAELVVEGQTGRLVRSADVADMAGALAWAAGHAEQARAMGQAGRRRVEERFSLPAMVAAYQALYDRLLAQREFQPG